MNSHQWQKHASHATLTLKAKSENGLFEESLNAVYTFMNPTRNETTAPIVNLDIKGKDMAHLLTEFLSDVIKWSNLHKVHYHSLIIHEISHSHLIGILEGNVVENFEHPIKAIASQNAHIEHKEGWMSTSIEFSL